MAISTNGSSIQLNLDVSKVTASITKLNSSLDKSTSRVEAYEKKLTNLSKIRFTATQLSVTRLTKGLKASSTQAALLERTLKRITNIKFQKLPDLGKIDFSNTTKSISTMNSELSEGLDISKQLHRELKSISKLNLNGLNKTVKAYTQSTNTAKQSTRGLGGEFENIASDLANFKQEIIDANNSTNIWSRSVKNITQTMTKFGATSNAVDTVTNSFTKLGNGINAIKSTTAFTKITESLRKISTTTKTVITDLRAMNKVNFGALLTGIGKISTELTQVGGHAKRTFSTMVSGAKSAGQAMSNAFRISAVSMLAVSARFYDIKQLITGSMKDFQELDKITREMSYQFSQLDSNIVSGSKSFSEFQQVGGDVGGMFQELETYAGLTAFSIKDTYASMNELAKTGYSVETAFGILKPAMLAADMNGQNLEETVHSVNGSLNAFGYKLKDNANAGEIFNESLSTMQEVADATGSDLSDLTKGMEYMAPIAGNVGISFRESAVLLGMLGDAGLEAEKGARVLASGLLNLTSPTAEAQASLNQLGVAIYDMQGNTRPAVEIVADLAKATTNLTDQQRAMHLETIFGKTSIKSWGSILSIGSDEMERLVGISKDGAYEIDYLNQKFMEVTFGEHMKQEVEKANVNLDKLGNQMVGFQYDMDETGAYVDEFGQKLTKNSAHVLDHSKVFDASGNIIGNHGEILLEQNKVLDKNGKYTAEATKQMLKNNSVISGTAAKTKILAFETEKARVEQALFNQGMVTLAETNPSKYFELLTEQIANFRTKLGGAFTELSAVPVRDMLAKATKSVDMFKDGLDELFPSLNLAKMTVEEFTVKATAMSTLLIGLSGAVAILVFSFSIFAGVVAAVTTALAGMYAFSTIESDVLSLSNAMDGYLMPSIKLFSQFVTTTLIPNMTTFGFSIVQLDDDIKRLGTAFSNLMTTGGGFETIKRTFDNLIDAVTRFVTIALGDITAWIQTHGPSLLGIFEDLSEIAIDLSPTMAAVFLGFLNVGGEAVELVKNMTDKFQKLSSKYLPDTEEGLDKVTKATEILFKVFIAGWLTVKAFKIGAAIVGLVTGIIKAANFLKKAFGGGNSGVKKLKEDIDSTTQSTDKLDDGLEDINEELNKIGRNTGMTSLKKSIDEATKSADNLDDDIEDILKEVEKVGKSDGFKTLKEDMDGVKDNDTQGVIAEIIDEVGDLGRHKGGKNFKKDMDDVFDSSKLVKDKVDDVTEAASKMGKSTGPSKLGKSFIGMFDDIGKALLIGVGGLSKFANLLDPSKLIVKLFPKLDGLFAKGGAGAAKALGKGFVKTLPGIGIGASVADMFISSTVPIGDSIDVALIGPLKETKPKIDEVIRGWSGAFGDFSQTDLPLQLLSGKGNVYDAFSEYAPEIEAALGGWDGSLEDFVRNGLPGVLGTGKENAGKKFSEYAPEIDTAITAWNDKLKSFTTGELVGSLAAGGTISAIEFAKWKENLSPTTAAWLEKAGLFANTDLQTKLQSGGVLTATEFANWVTAIDPTIAKWLESVGIFATGSLPTALEPGKTAFDTVMLGWDASLKQFTLMGMPLTLSEGQIKATEEFIKYAPAFKGATKGWDGTLQSFVTDILPGGLNEGQISSFKNFLKYSPAFKGATNGWIIDLLGYINGNLPTSLDKGKNTTDAKFIGYKGLFSKATSGWLDSMAIWLDSKLPGDLQAAKDLIAKKFKETGSAFDVPTGDWTGAIESWRTGGLAGQLASAGIQISTFVTNGKIDVESLLSKIREAEVRLGKSIISGSNVIYGPPSPGKSTPSGFSGNVGAGAMVRAFATPTLPSTPWTNAAHGYATNTTNNVVHNNNDNTQNFTFNGIKSESERDIILSRVRRK
jgi:predicted  nucleic acid-binding Zn-ribbon protein